MTAGWYHIAHRGNLREIRRRTVSFRRLRLRAPGPRKHPASGGIRSKRRGTVKRRGVRRRKNHFRPLTSSNPPSASSPSVAGSGMGAMSRERTALNEGEPLTEVLSQAVVPLVKLKVALSG